MALTEQDFMTEEDRQMQGRLALLKSQAETGAHFSDWVRTPASVIFLKMLDDQIQDSKNAWLLASGSVPAEVVRVQAQVYLKIKQWIMSQIQVGKAAEVGLKQFEDEGAALSNIVRMPERPESPQ